MQEFENRWGAAHDFFQTGAASRSIGPECPQALSRESLDEFRSRHGEWTSMSIHLGGDTYTLPPAPDARLRLLVQVASDLAGKPISQLRVLDLACLEGHYAIEFALQGAEAVGIEYRAESVDKASFVKDYLHLDHLTFCQDDVRNLSREKYGEFDVVICSGILYHLDAPDVFHFVRRILEVCTRLAIFDTHVALHAEDTVDFENQRYSGAWFQEHDESADQATKLKNLWASVDNNWSFWPTPASLSNSVARAGFSSFYECLNPYPLDADHRRAYVAIKGPKSSVLSSPKTEALGFVERPEVLVPSVFESRRGAIVRLAKRLLPGFIRAMRRPRSTVFRDEASVIQNAARTVPTGESQRKE